MYVGITKNTLYRRLSGHKSDSKKGNTKVHNWIKARQKDGCEIIIKLIEEIETDIIYFWEDYYIDLFKSWGFNLKNSLYSGYSENNVNNKGRFSSEAIQKLSLLNKGKILTKERVEYSVKRRLEEAVRRGYYHSNETKSKISKAHKGKSISKQEKIRLKEIRKKS